MPYRSFRAMFAGTHPIVAEDEPLDELIAVPACNCGVVGMQLTAAKVRLLKQYGAMLIGLRRSIPGAPNSMYTVVNPFENCTLIARCVASVPVCQCASVYLF